MRRKNIEETGDLDMDGGGVGHQDTCGLTAAEALPAQEDGAYWRIISVEVGQQLGLQTLFDH